MGKSSIQEYYRNSSSGITNSGIGYSQLYAFVLGYQFSKIKRGGIGIHTFDKVPLFASKLARDRVEVKEWMNPHRHSLEAQPLCLQHHGPGVWELGVVKVHVAVVRRPVVVNFQLVERKACNMKKRCLMMMVVVVLMMVVVMMMIMMVVVMVMKIS
jgi:hypothetical protein